MKVSREQAARNRAQVVDTASRLFRARGVEGVAIGEVMRECGLTHGGFYNQFESKEALAAEACAASLEKGVARWHDVVAVAPEEGAAVAIAANYLSPRNRDAPETGCALIALGPDAARRGGDLAKAFRQGLEALTAILQQAGPGMDRQDALARMAQMVGAMVLARGVSNTDLSDEILAATREAMGVCD
ncbi:TetR/AcrR family transcriptional regulator [Sphingobium sp. YR768]|jgi:TetR/AcrR family transcriptional repressor of nem operon|uniref:TetR/AcrR family transcriptional regulator n=1 Tax=Sphingobium sp. YR768 TaxID=1884365 RepID=UPI0008C7A86F|nr:TetR/AcrR family transcriptional regulator [Sphingobium sp. YR768]SES01809.1 transcriptional regulator, TetR family [Sphingobium sp. YR768]